MHRDFACEMESRDYQVEVLSRRRILYRIRAPDAETAERLAAERWQRGEASDVGGYDWSELEALRASELADTGAQAQDEELILRFITERERILSRLAGSLLTASLNDAISAAQAAADLGWSVRGSEVGSTADTARAAQALERLCEMRKLVCFQRHRVRANERGEIRLYCTPAYLERLSSRLPAFPSSP